MNSRDVSRVIRGPSMERKLSREYISLDPIGSSLELEHPLDGREVVEIWFLTRVANGSSGGLGLKR